MCPPKKPGLRRPNEEDTMVKTFNKAEAQVLMDRAVSGVLGQGSLGFATDGRGCQYRAHSKGTKTNASRVIKCVLGQLIADEFYSPEIESVQLRRVYDSHLAAKWVALKKAVRLSGIKEEYDEFIGLLQLAHDNAHEETYCGKWYGQPGPERSLRLFCRKVRMLALKYGLKTEVPDAWLKAHPYEDARD